MSMYDFLYSCYEQRYIQNFVKRIAGCEILLVQYANLGVSDGQFMRHVQELEGNFMISVGSNYMVRGVLSRPQPVNTSQVSRGGSRNLKLVSRKMGTARYLWRFIFEFIFYNIALSND